MELIKPIEWIDGKVRWLDVRLLPWEETYRETTDYKRIAQAIKEMEIRGAPAIGIAAAYGFALAVYYCRCSSYDELKKEAEKAVSVLGSTRPTAYNLFWALDYMKTRLEKYINEGRSLQEIKENIVKDAIRLHEKDIETNMKIGEYGNQLIEDGDTILTHCNAGSLATGGFGTALGVIRKAWMSGKNIRVIATETRPLLQGARLTVWELKKDGIPVTLITDNMVGYLMSKNIISKIVVGADRILLSGHVANKIGTYTISVLAVHHQVPFYVAAPTSTIDTKSRINEVVIEERNPDEVRSIMGRLSITLPDIDVYNPAFDITPPENVTAIITEKGIARKPFEKSLRKILEG